VHLRTSPTWCSAPRTTRRPSTSTDRPRVHRSLAAAERQLPRRRQAPAHGDGLAAEGDPRADQARIAYDATAYIRSAISEVVQTLLETILIVVIVIFLFLGSLRSSLVPVVAIPTSLIGGIFLVQTLGFTIIS